MSARIPSTSVPWNVYEHLAMVVGLGTLALLCLAWSPLAFVLRPLLPGRAGHWLGRQGVMRGFQLYLGVLRWLCACRFDIDAIDALRDQGPIVIVANHPSLLDAVLITSRLPNAVCVMKAVVMDNPLFGAGARLAGYVRNEPPLHVVLRCRDALRQGAQVVIFPESTRTPGYPANPVNPLSRTAALIAMRAGVPVQTLIVEFSSPYLGKGWSLLRPPQLPLVCRIRLGRRFDAPRDPRATTTELEAHLRAELAGPQNP